MPSVRIAAVQTEIRLHDYAANLSRAYEWASRAATQGVDLIVFPELALAGPIDGESGLIDRDGATLRDWQAVAGRAGVAIVTGSVIEGSATARRNRTYYVDSSGAVLGHHDKTRLWTTELGHGVAGDTVTVVPTEFGRVGLAICWDLTDAALIAGLAQAGADIICVPAYWCTQIRGDEVKHSTSAEATHVDALCIARAFENSVAIVFANAAGACVPCDPEFPKRLLGHSQVTVPFKGALNKAGHGDEALVIADVDLDLLADARLLYRLGRSDPAATPA